MDMQTAEEHLQKYFGYTSFRPGQRDIIYNLNHGHNVLGILPTGGGKSLSFQIPALMNDGVTIVISPLISFQMFYKWQSFLMIPGNFPITLFFHCWLPL